MTVKTLMVVSWVVTQCNFEGSYQYSGGTYWRWKPYIALKHWYTHTGLHSASFLSLIKCFCLHNNNKKKKTVNKCSVPPSQFPYCYKTMLQKLEHVKEQFITRLCSSRFVSYRSKNILGSSFHTYINITYSLWPMKSNFEEPKALI